MRPPYTLAHAPAAGSTFALAFARLAAAAAGAGVARHLVVELTLGGWRRRSCYKTPTTTLQ